jgi:prevent-host-death family protein
MLKTISATQARINFGDVMKQARIAPVIVERGGRAEVVVLSKKAYDQLVSGQANAALQKRIEDLQGKIRAELAGKNLPDPADLIRQGREERDEQIGNSLR